MQGTPNWQFGLLVAYVLPGFIGLAGLAPLFPTVARWLQPVGQGDLGIGPPVYAVLAAITMGMIVSCFRWLLIDRIHALTGVPASSLNYLALEERMAAFNYWVEQNYRYHQFYANTLIAVLWVGTDIGVILLCAGLFAGSRDALMKFRTRTSQLVKQVAEKDSKGDTMTNGADHNQGNGKTSDAVPVIKPTPRPQAAPEAEQAKNSNAKRPK
jgi:uncharacterized membrane protein YciS (DUF1049 family)